MYTYQYISVDWFFSRFVLPGVGLAAPLNHQHFGTTAYCCLHSKKKLISYCLLGLSSQDLCNNNDNIFVCCG